MKAIEMAVLKLLEYRLKWDTMSCSSCFAFDVFMTYNDKVLPCNNKVGRDVHNIEYDEKSKCINCRDAWVKAFELLEEKGIDIDDTDEFNC